VGENYKDDAMAVSAASRMARSRIQSKVGRSRSRKGSLALTAIFVIAVLIAMLWAMIKFGT